MKVTQLLEGRFIGHNIKNKKGVYKVFKDHISSEALAWEQSEIEAKDKDRAKFSKVKKQWYVPTEQQELTKMHRKLGIIARKPDPWDRPYRPTVPLKDVYDAFMDKVDRYFPDGDPMDHMGSFFIRHGIEFNHDDWVNRALKRFGRTPDEKKGYSHYLGTMWEETAFDRASWAQEDLDKGEEPEDHGDFYTINDDFDPPKAVVNDNPYWSYSKMKLERDKRAKAEAAWKKKNTKK
jgi:hypothetical protein